MWFVNDYGFVIILNEFLSSKVNTMHLNVIFAIFASLVYLVLPGGREWRQSKRLSQAKGPDRYIDAGALFCFEM